jgi:hypothetical protein
MRLGAYDELEEVDRLEHAAAAADCRLAQSADFDKTSDRIVGGFKAATQMCGCELDGEHGKLAESREQPRDGRM